MLRILRAPRVAYTLILLAGVRIVEVVAISLEKRKKIDDVFRPRATYCYVFFPWAIEVTYGDWA